MATLSLTWKDFNLNEDGFNIYRSETPMDVNNMPAPIATVGPNVGSYDDTTGIVGTTYYYRIGVIRGDEEKISIELKKKFDRTTLNINDIFDDGSVLATYKFDNSLDDLSGNYDAYIITGNEKYVPAKTGGSFDFDGTTELNINMNYTFSEITYSLWCSDMSNSVQLILEAQQPSLLMFHTSNNGFRFGLVSNQYSDFVVDKTGFNHWVVTWDGNTVTLYKNSVKVNSMASSSTPIQTTLVRVGNRQSYHYTGTIDQLRIFNRALTEAEVVSLYEKEYERLV